MGTTLLANDIAADIRKKIQDGRYTQNTRLTVRLLCEEYGVSETPVKQALNQLEGKGLVVAIPKCGVRVKSFDFEEMRNIWMARLMIEMFAADAAVEMARTSNRFRDKVQTLLSVTDVEYEHCREAFTKENFFSLGPHDYALHKEIVLCCDNPVIIDMYENLHTHERMFVGFDVHTPASLARTKSQHDAIIAALLSGDVVLLRKNIRDHIETTIDLYHHHGVPQKKK